MNAHLDLKWKFGRIFAKNRRPGFEPRSTETPWTRASPIPVESSSICCRKTSFVINNRRKKWSGCHPWRVSGKPVADPIKLTDRGFEPWTADVSETGSLSQCRSADCCPRCYEQSVGGHGWWYWERGRASRAMPARTGGHRGQVRPRPRGWRPDRRLGGPQERNLPHPGPIRFLAVSLFQGQFYSSNTYQVWLHGENHSIHDGLLDLNHSYHRW